MNYQPKRVTLFAGHYGSGKTNIALNFAFWLKNLGKEVMIADLDIVNPYFRTADSADSLKEAGIRLISSAYAGTNVDFPALPGEMYAITEDKSSFAVMDIGGDDRGAYALGRYVDALNTENNYEMIFVINRFRPLTENASLTIEVLREIEDACGMKFTGIVNNSNLGDLTTAEDILNSLSYADEVASLSGLPILFTSVREDLFSEIAEKSGEEKLLPLKLQRKIVD